jgi:hypothetical protein
MKRCWRSRAGYGIAKEGLTYASAGPRARGSDSPELDCTVDAAADEVGSPSQHAQLASATRCGSWCRTFGIRRRRYTGIGRNGRVRECWYRGVRWRRGWCACGWWWGPCRVCRRESVRWCWRRCWHSRDERQEGEVVIWEHRQHKETGHHKDETCQYECFHKLHCDLSSIKPTLGVCLRSQTHLCCHGRMQGANLAARLEHNGQVNPVTCEGRWQCT